MTMVETRPVAGVTGGVDTHLDTHVTAALDQLGGQLGVESFPANPAGYRALLEWLSSFGPVELVGIEGTGSYGAGLARHLRRTGVAVVEVDRPNRQDRHRQGKSDTIDAVAAAHAALSGQAQGVGKHGDGPIEAIRALSVRCGKPGER
jgi:transposase